MARLIDSLLTSGAMLSFRLFLLRCIDSIESKSEIPLPSVWVAKNRILSEGLTPQPGPWDWDVTPYFKDVIDLLHPSCPTRKIVLIKGAQIGATVGISENSQGWAMSCLPGGIISMHADQESAETMMRLRIEPMIESTGIKIFSQAQTKSNRRTGDTKLLKEYAGGYLLSIGPNSKAKTRGHTARVVIADEIDAYPPESTKGEDPLRNLERRTDAFSGEEKIVLMSTPGDASDSRIEREFLQGDQCRLYVPCKHCGEMQPLEWSRLKWKMLDDTHLDYSSVHYECKACGAAWKNEDKIHFLTYEKVRWIPTATPITRGTRSFHLSSLYSPVGFRSWESLVEEFIQAKGDPVKLKVFVTTVLGETWKDPGEVPAWEKIMLRREKYERGTVPKGFTPLLTTMGVDVQADRIECEVVAWSRGKESASVDYFVLDGDTSDFEGRPWRELTKILFRKYFGRYIDIALVDCGYKSSVVYEYVGRFSNASLGGERAPCMVFPCMGSPTWLEGKAFRFSKISGHALRRVELYTSLLKTEIYSALSKVRHPDAKEYPESYCHFPEDYDERHFRQLVSEERVKETLKVSGRTRYVWRQLIKRNEQLDCRVYALGAVYAYTAMLQEMAELDADMTPDEFWDIIADSRGGKGIAV